MEKAKMTENKSETNLKSKDFALTLQFFLIQFMELWNYKSLRRFGSGIWSLAILEHKVTIEGPSAKRKKRA
jgi:hypothetical protein